MAHYYWLNQGRLGNLLFQYDAILEITTPQDRVYSFHNEVFDLVDIDPRFVLIAGAGRLARIVCFRFDLIVRLALRHKIVGFVGVEPIVVFGRFSVEGSTVSRRLGFHEIAVRYRWVLQEGRRRDAIVKVKREYQLRAKKLLASVTDAPITVAVHIRLTDYKDWVVFGVTDASIPSSWYRERMAECRRRFVSPIFVVFSDDIDAAKAIELGPDVAYFHGTSTEDLTVMALCTHIIMSPSTFAWWGAVFVQTRR